MTGEEVETDDDIDFFEIVWGPVLKELGKM